MRICGNRATVRHGSWNKTGLRKTLKCSQHDAHSLAAHPSRHLFDACEAVIESDGGIELAFECST